MRRFQELSKAGELEADGEPLQIVAISKDNPAKVAAHAKRDNLDITLLSDEKLEVIQQFGLLHEGGIEFAISFDVLGVPMGAPTGFRNMAIPTTLLIDEARKIRWIDQADDYRMRSDATRVREAIADAFGAR